MRTLLLIPAFCLILLYAPACFGGEFTFEAGAGAGLEYNDNVSESSDNPEPDFVTHIKPVLKMYYQGGRVYGEINYRGDYQLHAVNTDYDDFSHWLDAQVRGELVENLFFLEIKEELQPVYRSARRGDLTEGDTTNDLISRNRFTVSPYLTLHPSERAELRLGYRFTDSRYSRNLGGQDTRNSFLPQSGSDFYFDTDISQQHSFFAGLSHQATDRLTLSANMDATRWIGESESGRDTSYWRYTAQIGGTYEVAEDTILKIMAGPAYTIYDHGSTSLWPFVTAELSWKVGRSEFGLSASMDFTDDPESGESLQHGAYNIFWKKEFDRSRLHLGFGYHTYEGDLSSSQYLTNAYRPFVNYSYDLTDRLQFTAGASLNMAENPSQGSSWAYANAGLKYELDEKSWVSLSYRYKYADLSNQSKNWNYGRSYSESPYSVNRIMLEFYFGF